MKKQALRRAVSIELKAERRHEESEEQAEIENRLRAERLSLLMPVPSSFTTTQK